MMLRAKVVAILMQILALERPMTIHVLRRMNASAIVRICDLCYEFSSDHLPFADHSCSDVIITGTQPLESFSLDSQPEDWPYKSMKMQYYGAEVGPWKNGWMENVPSNYTTDFGTLKC